MPVEAEKHFVTVRQAAARIGLSISLVYQLCHERRLPSYRVGSEGRRGRILIDPADLDAFVKACREQLHPLLASGKHDE